MAKAPTARPSVSPLSIRRYIATQAKLAAKSVTNDLKAEVKSELKKVADAEIARQAFPFDSDEYLDSPDREILTPKGFRLLFGDIGEKTVYKLVDLPDFPVLHISNTYRFSRGKVLEWAAGPGVEILKGMRQRSSHTRRSTCPGGDKREGSRRNYCAFVSNWTHFDRRN